MKQFIASIPGYIAWTRKALIQISTLLGVVLSLGLLQEPVKGYVVTAIAIIGTVLHYITSNGDKPTAPTTSAPEPVEGTIVEPKALPVGSYPDTREIPVIQG